MKENTQDYLNWLNTNLIPDLKFCGHLYAAEEIKKLINIVIKQDNELNRLKKKLK